MTTVGYISKYTANSKKDCPSKAPKSKREKRDGSTILLGFLNELFFNQLYKACQNQHCVLALGIL